MENIKKNFGFGCMRLPLKDGEIDLAETSRMVDYFLEQGFNYFDEWDNLVDHMLARGFGQADIEKVLGGNLMRVFRQVWDKK